MASVSSFRDRDPKELHALKLRAMRYYQENGVPVKMEEVLNSMFHEDPNDVYGHLVNFFEQFTKPATLKRVTAQKIIDCLGQPAILSNVYCTVNNKEKLVCSLGIPNINIKAKPEDREKAELDLQESVGCAIEIINQDLSHSFAVMDPKNQSEVDDILNAFIEKKREEDLAKKAIEEANKIDLPPPAPFVEDKDHKKSAKKGGKSSIVIEFVPDKPPEYFTAGSEVVAAISQTVCACAAMVSNVPIYRHIANIVRTKGALNEFRIPLPMVTIVQSGKQGAGKVKCIRDYMIVPGPDMYIDKSITHIQNIYNYVAKSFIPKMGITAKYMNEIGALCPPADTPTQILDLLQEAVNAEGLTIGEDIFLAIDAAAHECFDYEKGKYEVVSGVLKTGDEMVEFWADIVNKYPSICAIIDPLRAQDSEPWSKLCERVSENVYIVGDNYYDRPGQLKKEEMVDPVQTSGITFHLEGMTSISDIIECTQIFQNSKNEIIIAANQGDTCDTFLVDLAVGLNARFLKIGGPRKGERVAKLNRLFQIFSELDPPAPTNEEEEDAGDEPPKIDNLEQGEDDENEEEKGNVEESEKEEEVQEEEEIKEEEEKTWGHDLRNCLKNHTPFFYPFIEKKLPPKVEEDEQEEHEGNST